MPLGRAEGDGRATEASLDATNETNVECVAERVGFEPEIYSAINDLGLIRSR